MGATLPAISRWLVTTPKGVSWLGFFYGGNIAGAVFGCLFAGFYLLRVHDMADGDFVGRGGHQRVSWLLMGLALAGVLAFKSELRREIPAEITADVNGSGLVYIAIALSGLSALGAPK